MSDRKLRIAEIFTSIQGEGSWIGIPSTFVRISGCNLRCVWCDTPYASWNPEGPMLSVNEVANRASCAGVSHVVLTGGEPMVFEPIVELATLLRQRGHTITIETAGTVYRELPCDLMSISPKLANSIPPSDSGWKERHERTRLNLDVLAALMEAYDCQLKFVLTNEEEIAEVDNVLAKLPATSPDRVLIMAEGVSSEVQRSRMRKLVGLCISRGWRLTPRLHIDLFGHTRGT